LHSETEERNIRGMDAILYFQAKGSVFAPEKLAGAEEVAAAAGVHVQVVDEAPDARRFADLADFWRPLGAIVDCGSIEHPDAAAFGTVPAVFLSGVPDDLPPGAMCVRHDSAATARRAARELMETGFRNFAFVPSREPRRWSDERGEAFAEAIRLNGLRCVEMERPAEGGGATAWQRALRTFVRALPFPCGLFAANDATAAEVLVAARFEDVAVPEKLAVLGVDDFAPVCERTAPTLSSVRPDFRGAGRTAALMLLERARAASGGGKSAKPDAVRTFGPLGVSRRASTRAPAVGDKCAADALEKIRREACSGLRARDAAALFPCSRRMADARFRAATGRSFLEEIHAARLDRAKRLLEETDMPLKALADFCGFETPNALRKFFRAATGATMKQWRRRSRASGGVPGEGRRRGASGRKDAD